MSTNNINDLKKKFIAGAIPLAEDYNNLLTMLEDTRIATMTSPDSKVTDGTGLELNDNSVLAVKLKPNSGIELSSEGIGVKLAPNNSGLIHDSWGLYVKPAQNGGIKIDNNGLSIAAFEIFNLIFAYQVKATQYAFTPDFSVFLSPTNGGEYMDLILRINKPNFHMSSFNGFSFEAITSESQTLTFDSFSTVNNAGFSNPEQYGTCLYACFKRTGKAQTFTSLRETKRNTIFNLLTLQY